MMREHHASTAGLATAIEAKLGPVGRACRHLNPGVFGAVGAEPGPTRQHESDLQADCERWLEAHGYMRRTSANIQTTDARRWFVHFPRTKGNPIVLDLIIMDAERGVYLEAELKVKGGNVSTDQRCLLLRGDGVLCWSVADLKTSVLAWEQSPLPLPHRPLQNNMGGEGLKRRETGAGRS